MALEKARRGETLEIWGDGNGAKDYIYITDFCKILFLLLKQDIDKYCVLNIGSGMLLTVNDIVESIKNNYCHDFKWEYKQVNDLDVKSFTLDLSKLMSLIPGFQFTTFTEGLSLTNKWYDDNKKN